MNTIDCRNGEQKKRWKLIFFRAVWIELLTQTCHHIINLRTKCWNKCSTTNCTVCYFSIRKKKMCVWFIDFFLSRASFSCDWISGCTIPCWFVYQCESSMGKRTAQHIDDSTEFHRFFSPIFFFIASHRIASISLFNFMVRWICEFLAAKFRPKDTQSTGKTWKIHEKYTINANLLYCLLMQNEKKK